MTVGFAYSPALDAYDLGPGHPFRPERASLTAALLTDYGVVGPGALAPLTFDPATPGALLRVHDEEYLRAVRAASDAPERWPGGRGIGPGDTPAFAGMHEASAAIAGATCAALSSVLEGRHHRAFAPAGGLHHAHRERAAGFCVYNDVAIAIAAALERDPGLRICYLDIDAHHGDGVQEAFYQEPRVLTISLHEDGRYLYPGTGSWRERGAGSGTGSVLNLPMPPYADDRCYLHAFEQAAAPAVLAFAPHILVTQNGADGHWSDPLTTLGLTIGGYEALYAAITALADEACGGRVVACGGGGYSWLTVVPRVWTLLAASLLEHDLPDELPDAWRQRVREVGGEPPTRLRHDPGPALDDDTRERVWHDTGLMLQRALAG
jgi:acetoin utilization protein AcuC